MRCSSASRSAAQHTTLNLSFNHLPSALIALQTSLHPAKESGIVNRMAHHFIIRAANAAGEQAEADAGVVLEAAILDSAAYRRYAERR